MRDLRERFEEAAGMRAPDLWPDIESRRPGSPPRNPRRAWAVGVALILTAGIVLSGVWLAGRSPEVRRPAGLTPSPSPTDEQRSPRNVTGRFEFVPQTLISASESRLRIDAPPGIGRWVLDCRSGVSGHALDGSQGSSGFGADCPVDALIGWGGGIGGIYLVDRHYLAIAGRALPDPGSKIRATLADGRSMTLSPAEGLWIFVLRAADKTVTSPDPGSRVVRLERLDADGKVTFTVPIPGNMWGG
jgi:hypothetical protein